MKTVKNHIMAAGIAMAVAIAVWLPNTTNAADQVKGAERLMMKPIKTTEDIAKVEPGDMVAMSCPKCKTITVTYVETTKGHIKEEKATQKHLCPGCETVIKTEGINPKLSKEVVKHVCKTCGSEDAFCCVLKKGSGPTKGMEKEKK